MLEVIGALKLVPLKLSQRSIPYDGNPGCSENIRPLSPGYL